MNNPAQSLLQSLYGDNIPRRLTELVDEGLQVGDLVDFKINPVLNSNEHRLTRIAFARKGERQAWIQRIANLWNSPETATFLSGAPAHARQMVDSDGSREFMAYIDDLQPPPLPLLAITLSPKVGPGLLLRVPTPPADLPELIAGSVGSFQEMSPKGQWAIRQSSNEIIGVLWVSESRWRGDADETTAMVLNLPMAPGWMDRWRGLVDAGFHPYPDAVEFRLDGTADLTVGFLPG